MVAIIMGQHVYGQQDSSEIKNSPQLALGLDLWGVTAMPVLAKVDDATSNRLAFTASILLNERWFFDLKFGKETRQANQLGDDFMNYKMKGIFFSPAANLRFRNRSNWYFGFGLLFGKQEEQGTVFIEGDYFPAYSEDLYDESGIFGSFVKLGYEAHFAKQLSLRIEASPGFGSISADEARKVQRLETVAGSGVNGVVNGKSYTGCPVFLNLVYTFK